MSLSDTHVPDDDFLASLLAYDEALATGQPPPAPAGSSAPPDLAPRMERTQWCLQLLEELWPRNQPRAVRGPSADDLLAIGRELPASIGRFRIRKELKQRGGRRFAFLAFDPQRKQDVVLKVPNPGAYDTPEARWRFVRQAQAVAGLDHPGLVPVYEAGVVGTTCFLVSALCEGEWLSEWLTAHQPVPVRQAAALVAFLAAAVHHAHGRAIVHRRLHPGCIVLQPRPPAPPRGPGRDLNDLEVIPRLIDCGLADLFEKDTAPDDGTSCRAPEQLVLGSHPVGPHTDIYALGAILYEALTGSQPLGGQANRQAGAEPVRPKRLRRGLPRALDTITLKCLEKNPDERYPSALALADDLRSFLAGKPIWARRPGILRRLRRWLKQVAQNKTLF